MTRINERGLWLANAVLCGLNVVLWGAYAHSMFGAAAWSVCCAISIYYLRGPRDY